MKKRTSFILSAGALVVAGYLIQQSSQLSSRTTESQRPAQSPTTSHTPDSSSTPHSRTSALAPHSADARPATLSPASSVNPDHQPPTGDFQQWPIGHVVSLQLPRTPHPVSAKVIHTGTQADGTVVTQLQIEEPRSGILTLQENTELGFFEGHILFDNSPTAYLVSKLDNSLAFEESSVENILCSQADNHIQHVDSGLPVFGAVVKARGSNGKGNKTPRLSVGNASADEGDSGSSLMRFQITLSSASTTEISATFATSDNSASAPTDYASTSGSLTLLPGQTSFIVEVPIFGDTDEENDETFSLNLLSVTGANVGNATGVGTILDDDTLPPPPTGGVPILNSRLSSTAVAYLDMDGETVTNTPWNSGRNRNGITVSGISDTYSTAEMTAIWEKVAEDYAPFDINVTTEESVYLNAPSNRRIRCIITPDWQWFGQAGGVAYLNSFTWTGDTPCWVFSSLLANYPKYISDAASHEVGHTLGLSHDGRTSPSEGYYEGHGSGITGWAPIMGVGYYQNLVQWSKGEYLNANNTEDDLLIITSNNGFSYRIDDHSDSQSGATSLPVGSLTGVIEKRTDADTFTFTLSAEQTVQLTAIGTTQDNNLDIALELSSSLGVISTANPINDIDATLTTTLGSGTYYVRIRGTGKGDVLGTGYSDYGSLGEYQITRSHP